MGISGGVVVAVGDSILVDKDRLNLDGRCSDRVLVLRRANMVERGICRG